MVYKIIGYHIWEKKDKVFTTEMVGFIVTIYEVFIGWSRESWLDVKSDGLGIELVEERFFSR